MPLLTSGDLAKELIRRRQTHTTAREQAVNTTASYEMVEDEGGLQHEPYSRIYGRRFWRRKLRVGVDDGTVTGEEGSGAQTGGVTNRIVSEPVAPSMKEKMLGRLRFRRASESAPLVEGDSMETTESDITGFNLTNDEISLAQPTSSPTKTPSRSHDNSEAGPSFISFSPAASSVRYIHRTPPSRRTLAPTLRNPDSTNRNEAVRAVTLEARLAQHSISDDHDLEPSSSASYSTQNPEYPSLAYIDPDSSSDIKGILRARNSRAPPNTPYPTVRFVDPWLTSIRNESKQPKPHANADGNVSTEDDSLPAAQISGGARWKRLGAILGAIDRGLSENSTSSIDISHDVGVDPLDVSITDTPITTSFSSDSPICFARFDTGDMISSTPLRKPRILTTHALASPFSTPPRASRDPTHSSSSFSPSSSCLLPNEEEAMVENCSALEGLWEYGSSEGSEAAAPDITNGQHHTPNAADVATPSTPLSPRTPQSPPLSHSHSPIVNMGTSGLEVRRGSGELLPLKYTGRVAHKIEDDPFPFATSLRYQV